MIRFRILTWILKSRCSLANQKSMKVKMLVRNPDEYLRETKMDIYKIPRNLDPRLHPFEAQREYVRALNAVKLERVFAKPFVGCLDGHKDGVSAMIKHPTKLSTVASGSFDGEVRLWNLPTRRCVQSFQGHEGAVRGLAFIPDGTRLISVGDDQTIKTWNCTESQFELNTLLTSSILSKSVLTGISHNLYNRTFATCGEICQLWEETRNEPIKTFKWNVDSLHHVAFNPIETYVIGACGSDRSIILYDVRERGPIRKVVLELRSNQISWNPMEAYTFTAANEDYNLYTFDTRNLSAAVTIHKDHVSAVLSVDYSPTGQEFVTGSYDKTMRIFGTDKRFSREVYHTKRMQRLTNVIWSLDDKFVLSASDEMNIRIWKARASEKLGMLNGRERRALNYSAALKQKFQNFPQVKRIARHRQVPKHVYNARKEHRVIHQKQKRKEANRRAHSKPGSVPFVPEAKKHIVGEQE